MSGAWKRSRPTRPPPLASSRRAVLGSGALALLLEGRAAAAETPPEPLRVDPQVAVGRLMDGNDRFVRHKLLCFDEDLDELRRGATQGQAPFAAVLSCADSRVPVELVFDQSIGRIFVTRVAGNVAATEVIASLKYGAAILGVSVIVVLAHESCGAVKAAIGGSAAPGQISALYAPLRGAVDRGGGDAEAVAKANARLQTELLSRASPVLSDLVREGRLTIAPAYYHLASGRVELL